MTNPFYIHQQIVNISQNTERLLRGADLSFTSIDAAIVCAMSDNKNICEYGLAHLRFVQRFERSFTGRTKQ